MAMLLVHCVVLLAASGSVLSRSAGPPANTVDVCRDITPRASSHNGGQGPQAGNGGYVIATDADLALDLNSGVYSYTAGVTYDIQVRNVDSAVPLRGFLVRAVDPANTPIGTFVVVDQAQQQLIDCDMIDSIPAGTTIGHRNSPGDFLQQTFQWTAPSDADGFVNFMFAVVQVQATYYANQNAAQVASALGAAPEVLGVGTMPPAATETLPATVTDPVDRNPEDYRITMRSPDDCAPSECDVFVGIDTNEGDDEWLDFYMEANADIWVAVGFSRTNDMLAADVVGCNVNPTTGMVDALDTWNNADPPRTNRDEDNQDVALFPGRGSIENGRIKCTFARNVVGTNVGVDDLSLNEPYYPMFGSVSGTGGRTSSFSIHPVSATGIPMRPGVMVNPLTDGMAIGGVASTVATTSSDVATTSSSVVLLVDYFIQLSCIAIATMYSVLSY